MEMKPTNMWSNYLSATHVEEVLQALAHKGAAARIVAGATDLMLEMERGVRQGIDTLIDITRIPGLDDIYCDADNCIHLGPLTTHNHCVASPLIIENAFPLAQAAWEVGSPQIRNRGTIAGNVITASPANDTITPLMALNASVVLSSSTGKRVVPLEEFYIGVRKTVMAPDEMLTDIHFPAMTPDQRGVFIKIGLRKAQAIAVVNAAILLTLNGQRIEKAVITLGAVAPTIIHAVEAEQFLEGKTLDDAVMQTAASFARASARPIDDVRGSADYRREMVRVAVLRGLRQIAAGREREGFPEQPPLLRLPTLPAANSLLAHSIWHGEAGSSAETSIHCRINGKAYTFYNAQRKNLLRLLREDAGLIGTKEGCAEGECGACTVILDGMAVMSCLVPAPRAHGAEILTVEGLSQAGVLHPVQKAFIETGAVQCGYCTPGFVMSAAALLQEIPHPSTNQIRYALTGNLCRCTGYYKIIEAVERAASAA